MNVKLRKQASLHKPITVNSPTCLTTYVNKITHKVVTQDTKKDINFIVKNDLICAIKSTIAIVHAHLIIIKDI